jgi:hypothetical protein
MEGRSYEKQKENPFSCVISDPYCLKELAYFFFDGSEGVNCEILKF